MSQLYPITVAGFLANDMKIVTIKIEDLVPAEYNPRQATEKQFEDLKKSIQKFGIVDPIIVNKRTQGIVGGHFRVEVAKSLDIDEVPCVYVDLTDEEEKELNIRLNQNTGSWDWDKLAGLEKDFLVEWGFDSKELDFKFGTGDESESLGYSIDCPYCAEKIKVSNRVKTVEKI